ncbi:MAG: tRNA (adenosine(37)-N6)-threonylcarbamoyltransferase complex ATPase subunit type 1 TsaE [Candidatus Obscuribacterales bacterium]|nr:tRNA (adenosine(37)-N6)-threonylcarbamoyltransferase complex ATPase subunit type 1 TsaE [Steroidobacteraceae bacterium]
MREVEFATSSAEATRLLGERLARAIAANGLEQPLVVTLSGELGAGKTTFVSGFLRAMGVTGPVRSPTYTLIEPYEFAERCVYHLDLYRLVDARDLEMLALRDLLQPSAVLLVEWAERGAGALPVPDLALTLHYESDVKSDAGSPPTDARRIVIRCTTLSGETLLNKLVASAS